VSALTLLAEQAGARVKTEEWSSSYSKVYAKHTEYVFTEEQLAVFAELLRNLPNSSLPDGG
jgi:hypothetical protein